MTQRPIRHPLLDRCRVEHGFGVRGAAGPPGLVRPMQVHGAAVATQEECARAAPREADAVVSSAAGVPVGVATADCVPILVATERARAVAAIHAGWRGLARGVVRAGVDALRQLAGPSEELVAVLGPHIGPCCYEVDAPVLEALAERFSGTLAEALAPAREGHAMLDLGVLVRSDLAAAGIAPAATGALAGACTCCDPVRFHSYRRDGPGCGRLQHFIAARSPEA
jgi:YfiH family protein